MGWFTITAAAAVLFGLLPFLCAQVPVAYRVSTYAGTLHGDGDHVPATQLILNMPRDIARDSRGNVYVSDSGSYVIRRISPNGQSNIVAGTAGIPGTWGDGGPAVAARIGLPTFIAVDHDRYLYFADYFLGADYYSTQRIWRIDLATGIINHVAGGGSIDDRDGEPGLATRFFAISGLGVDHDGGLIIADLHRIRRLSPSDGRITTIADLQPTLDFPMAPAGKMAIHPSGDIYFGENDGPGILRFSNGVKFRVTTAARDVEGMAFDSLGANLYYSVYPGSIWKMNLQSQTSVLIAGSVFTGFEGDGGPAQRARFNLPHALVLEPDGAILIADTGNNRIRSINANGVVSTIAGGWSAYGGDGGPALSAIMHSPSGLKTDPEDNLIVSDSGNCSIRTVSLAGQITNLAGPVTVCGPPGRLVGARDEAGNVFLAPGYGLFVQRTGTNALSVRFESWVRDFVFSARKQGFHAISLSPGQAQVVFLPRDALVGTIDVTPSHEIGGRPFTGNFEGLLPNSAVFAPSAVALDADDSLFLLDTGLARIQILRGGAISIFAAARALVNARYLAVEASGAVWVTVENYVMRLGTDGRSVTHVIGNSQAGYTTAGHDGSLARFNDPNGIAIRRDGAVYIADTGNRVIRKLTPVRIASMNAVTNERGPGEQRHRAAASVRVLGADDLPVTGFNVSYVVQDENGSNSYSANTDIDGIVQVGLPIQSTGAVTFTINGLPPVVIPFTGSTRNRHRHSQRPMVRSAC